MTSTTSLPTADLLTTREACQVLGRSEPILRRYVDQLRRHWDPDLGRWLYERGDIIALRDRLAIERLGRGNWRRKNLGKYALPKETR